MRKVIDMSRMNRYTLSATPLSLSLPSSFQKIIFHAGSEDIFFMYNQEGYGGSEYFTLAAGTTLILDQPVGFPDSLFVRVLSDEGSLEIWTLG